MPGFIPSIRHKQYFPSLPRTKTWVSLQESGTRGSFKGDCVFQHLSVWHTAKASRKSAPTGSISGMSLAHGKWQELSQAAAPVQFFPLYSPQQHFQRNPDQQKNSVLTFAKWSLLVLGFLFFIFDLLGLKTEPRKIRGRRVKVKNWVLFPLLLGKLALWIVIPTN